MVSSALSVLISFWRQRKLGNWALLALFWFIEMVDKSRQKYIKQPMTTKFRCDDISKQCLYVHPLCGIPLLFQIFTMILLSPCKFDGEITCLRVQTKAEKCIVHSFKKWSFMNFYMKARMILYEFLKYFFCEFQKLF